MKDDHDLYLKCDFLPWADAFQKFRSNSIKDYGLCPSHYLSAPALSWGAMLNMAKVKLEHQKGMRGRVKQEISIRNLMTQNKNQDILYLDVNNLYGYAMPKFFPKSGFKLD